MTVYCLYQLFSICSDTTVNYFIAQTESWVLTIYDLTYCTERL